MKKYRKELGHFSKDLDGGFIGPRLVFELHMTAEMLSECYMFYSFNAASNLKKRMLEEFAKQIDQAIIDHDRTNDMDGILKRELDKVKIINEN